MYNKYNIQLLNFFLKITLTKTAILKLGEDLSTAHLKDKNVQKVCNNMDTVCDNITVELCAVRLVNDTFEYKQFDNICLLFISNMCVYVGNEYFIIQRGNCISYLKNRPNWIIMKHSESDTKRRFNKMRSIKNSRRNKDEGEEIEEENSAIEVEDNNVNSTVNKENINANNTINHNDDNAKGTIKDNGNSTVHEEDRNSNGTVSEEDGKSNSTASKEDGNSYSASDLEDATEFLRDQKLDTTTRFKGLYETLEAYDGHICPMSCPNIYAPLCLMINRNYGGMHYKFMTFVNHCQYDIYYCTHPEAFTPPPVSDPEVQEANDFDVKTSYMGWSSCASTKYFAFTRFSEAASSMGHFGWLDGVSAHRIADPRYRKPGYG